MSRPIHNPVSFGAFARSMLNSSLDEISTYYDSDGEEVDLTETFGDDENSDAGSSDDRDTLLNYDSANDTTTNENPDLDDITSRATNFRNRQLVEHTLKSLEDLTSFVQPTLNEQPLSTQTILASQATDIFKSYAEHGSEARLSAGILRFLQGGEIVRAKGRGGRYPEQDRQLRLAPIDTATKIDNIYDELGNSRDKSLPSKIRNSAIQSSEELKRKKRRGCILVPDKTCDPQGLRLNIIASANAQIPLIAWASGSSNVALPMNRGIANLHSYLNIHRPPTQPFLARTHQFVQQQASVTLKIQFPPGYLDALNRIFQLYNAEARYLLSYFVGKYSPGLALGVAESDEQGTKVESPHALFRLAITQLLQSKVDGIVREAVDDDLGLGPRERSLLRSVFEQVGVTEVCTRAHRTAYQGGDSNIDDVMDEDEDMSEDLDSTTSLTDDEYYARISSYNGSDIEDDLLDRCADDNAQADPDTQSSSILDSFIRPPRFLSKERPSTLVEDLIAGRVYVETGLNVLEKEILARSVGTDTEVIEKFWAEMRKKRRAWGALRGWCRMMEGRRVSIAKKNGTW